MAATPRNVGYSSLANFGLCPPGDGVLSAFYLDEGSLANATCLVSCFGPVGVTSVTGSAALTIL